MAWTIPPKDFWENFPKHRNWRSGTPFKIDVTKLELWVNQAGASEELVTLFEQVKEDVINGALNYMSRWELSKLNSARGNRL